MKEMAKRRKDWNTRSELDSVKVVVAALVPSTGYQAEIFLSSAPLKSPKEVGDEIQYNAVFPLKGRDSNGAPTRMIMPGLLQREKGCVCGDCCREGRKGCVYLRRLGSHSTGC